MVCIYLYNCNIYALFHYFTQSEYFLYFISLTIYYLCSCAYIFLNMVDCWPMSVHGIPGFCFKRQTNEVTFCPTHVKVSNKLNMFLHNSNYFLSLWGSTVHLDNQKFMITLLHGREQQFEVICVNDTNKHII